MNFHIGSSGSLVLKNVNFKDVFDIKSVLKSRDVFISKKISLWPTGLDEPS